MKQRVELIDALRGFSLIGILFANLLIFQYGMVGKDFLDDLGVMDSISYYFTKIFIETSFMPIFAIIFGYSLIKLFESIKTRQHKTRWPLIRRAIGLMVLGFLHSYFIWDGDILLFYGMTMFILLFFLYRKPKTMFIWSGILFVLSMLFSIGPNMDIYDKEKTPIYIAEEKEVLSTGAYSEILDFRQNSELPIYIEGIPPEVLAMVLLIFSPLMYLPLFLLGMGLAKLNTFATPLNEIKMYRNWTLLIIVGLALKVVGVLDFNYSDSFYTAGGPILAVGYVFGFALLYTTKIGEKYSKSFVYVGKLSLTNYLMQSVILTFIFYGYGFGLFASIGTTWALVIGLGVYIAQVFASRFYLKYFKRGPVEKVLRIWTNFRLS